MKRYEKMTRAELVRSLKAAERATSHARPAARRNGALQRELNHQRNEPKLQERDLNKARREAEASRDCLAELFDHAPVACITLNGRGIIKNINLTGARLLGAGRSALLGQPFSQFVARGASEGLARHLTRCRRTQQTTTSEFLLFEKVPDGPRHVQLVSLPVREAGARGMTFRTVMLDITARKRTEAALGESVERFRQLAENITEVFWLSDPALKQVLYVSPSYEAVWGRTCASLYASPMQWEEAIHAEDRPRVAAAIAQKLLSGAYDEEYRITQPDGTMRWIRDRAFPIKDQTGQIHRVAGLAEDITERKEIEARANEAQGRFRLFAENIREVFWMTDLKTRRMIYISPGYQKVWGRTSLYQSPQDWLAQIVPEDRERVWEAAQTKQVTGEYDLVYRIRRPDGSIRWIHDRAFPVRDESGEAVRIAGIADDITERKLIEKELIEISDREQCRFGQDLHDGLCQHLAGIEYLTQSLKAGLADKGHAEADQAAQIAMLIGQASAHAHDLARGLSPVPLEAGGLASALQELAATSERLFRVRCELRSDGSVLVHDNTVATHLYRIAQEAVSNAIKHGQARRIIISLGRNQHWTVLSIKNDGAELPEGPPGSAGLGGRIMNFRAAMIGGVLELRHGPDRQPTVVCSVPALSVRQPPTRNA